ncbi:MAG: DnaJ domain-containing protein [Pseudolabrys sp.]|nr:DnaJ domain-containing protein [Pseudolabrys sp.]
MKFDSPLFDKIRIKPENDRRPKKPGPRCQWSGCKNEAGHRAPKGRGKEKDYWNFCIEHVREYNQNYNFFSGMTDDAVLAYQKDALTGHRPTWKMGTGKRGAGRPDLGGAADPFHMFHELGGRGGPDPDHKPEQRIVRNAERKALETLGLEAGAATLEIKSRFKELVKRHHPDANGGDRSSEDRLVEIIQAYNYLKSLPGFS